MPREPRALTPKFKVDLTDGILSPLLDLVRKDRDLLLEIRDGYIDVYFKGNGLFKIEACSTHSSDYLVSTHEKFASDLNRVPLRLEQDMQRLLDRLPHIKHQISIHKPRASEIEIEHFLMRMNNCEPGVNSEYFAIDRQGVYGSPPRNDRIDVLGVYWPRATRRTAKKADLCVMEVKFAMGARIGDLATQLQRYYDILSSDLKQIASDAQALLRDKIDLGLLGDDDRLEKLKQLRISDNIDDVRCLVILAEQNPFSKALDPDNLSPVRFKQIEVFRLGYGLWSCDAYRLAGGKWRRPAAFGETELL